MKILKDITEFIFVENDIKDLKKVDIIFMPGSSRYQLPELERCASKKWSTI